MFLRATLLIFSAMILAGCSGTGVLRATKPNVVVGAVGPTGVGYRSPRVNSLVDAFERDYLVSFCFDGGTVAVQPDSVTERGPVKLVENPMCAPLFVETSGANAFQTVQPMFRGLTSEGAARRMTESGFRLTKSVCLAYFNRIGNQGQDNDFYKKLTNVLSGVTSATLGLTGSPSKSVALTATGFSGFLAGLESFDEVYHYTPDRQNVLDLILRSMNAYEAEVMEKGRYKTFNQSIDAILGYQSMCQTDYIRSTVNEAISAANIRAFSTPNLSQLTTTSLTSVQRQSLAASVGAASLSDAQIRVLIRASRGEIANQDDLESAFETLQNIDIGLVAERFNDDGTPAEPRFEFDEARRLEIYTELDTFQRENPRLYAQYVQQISELSDRSGSVPDSTAMISRPVELSVVEQN